MTRTFSIRLIFSQFLRFYFKDYNVEAPSPERLSLVDGDGPS